MCGQVAVFWNLSYGCACIGSCEMCEQVAVLSNGCSYIGSCEMCEQAAVFWNLGYGCAYIGNCEMCEKVAMFKNLSYGGENNKPNDPRPHACFRNKK